MPRKGTIIGDLRAVTRFEPGTLYHFEELSRDQIRNTSLCENPFYVADFPLYTVLKGKAILGLARHTVEHPNNLALNHLFDQENSSFDQLLKRKHFRPHPDEAQAAWEAADTLKVELSGLNLSVGYRENVNYCFIKIRTRDGFVLSDDGWNYNCPNELERALLQRVGYTEDFLSVLNSRPHCRIRCSMDQLDSERYSNITKVTYLYLLKPTYVVTKARKGFIGQVACRYNFTNDAESSLTVLPGWDLETRAGLRGLRLGRARGAAVSPEEATERIMAGVNTLPDTECPTQKRVATPTIHPKPVNPRPRWIEMDDPKPSRRKMTLPDYYTKRRIELD